VNNVSRLTYYVWLLFFVYKAHAELKHVRNGSILVQ
jgi:hypothetical protein